jgi:ABC-type transporter Mla subunit MlaD
MNYGLFGLLGIPNGIDTIGSVARTVQGAADTLDAEAPQIADFARETAQTIERLSNDLRERSLGEIAASVSNFAREEPVAFFGGAVLAGFVLARLTKRTAPQNTSYVRQAILPHPNATLNGDNRTALSARSF